MAWINEDAFWLRAHRTPDGCWPWLLAPGHNGYGRFGKPGLRAHRVAYALANGPIPDGSHVLHDCDNPACVRPSHLKLGTHQDNMRDRDRKGRGSRMFQRGFDPRRINDRARLAEIGRAGALKRWAK
jgi:hypothetical protein